MDKSPRLVGKGANTSHGGGSSMLQCLMVWCDGNDAEETIKAWCFPFQGRLVDKRVCVHRVRQHRDESHECQLCRNAAVRSGSQTESPLLGTSHPQPCRNGARHPSWEETGLHHCVRVSSQPGGNWGLWNPYTPVEQLLPTLLQGELCSSGAWGWERRQPLALAK